MSSYMLFTGNPISAEEALRCEKLVSLSGLGMLSHAALIVLTHVILQEWLGLQNRGKRSGIRSGG